MKAYEVVLDVLKKEGLSKNDPDEKFDPEQLAMGIKVEVEHGKSKEMAKEIAKDHLSEFPNYYTALAKMEKGLEKDKKLSNT